MNNHFNSSSTLQDREGWVGAGRKERGSTRNGMEPEQKKKNLLNMLYLPLQVKKKRRASNNFSSSLCFKQLMN